MAVSSSHRRARSGLVLATLFALTASLSGSALAATPPPASQLIAQGPQAGPDDPPADHGKAKGNKHRPSDLLSAMGLAAQHAQAGLGKKTGNKFVSLDKEACDNDPECENEDSNGDPDYDGPAGGQAETSIAIDSTGQHVVVGFNDTRGFSLNPTSVSGYIWSDDGGATFHDGGQLPVTTGTNTIGSTILPQVFGDPEVKYLGGSNFAYVSILVKKFSATGTAQTMGYHLSNDYGHTWTGPYEIGPATNPNGLLSGANARDAADKEFADYDPTIGSGGRFILSWSNFTTTTIAPGGVEISTTFSDDITAPLSGGTTHWSTRAKPGVTAEDGQASIPRFADGGRAYIAWRRFPSSLTSPNTNRTTVARSIDSGASWTTVNTTGAFFTMDQVLGNDRVNTSPSLAVDRSPGARNGWVYVVFSDNDSHDGADIAFQRSTDFGVSWTAPLMINSRPGNDRAQWEPWVTVDNSTGRIYVTYYDQGIASSGDLTEETYLYSDDGGTTWAAPRPLSNRPFHAGWGNDTGQPNLGDYNQAVAQNGEVFAEWAQTAPVGFTDGLPGSLSFTTPDATFGRVPASSTRPPLRLGAISFSDSGNGGNGSIDASESIHFTIPLENYVTNAISQTTVSGIGGTLSTTTPGVAVTQGLSSYANIGPGGAASNATPYALVTSAGFVIGTPIELTLTLSTAQGAATLLYTQVTGTPSATTIFSESFDGPLGANGLPAGWATSHAGGANAVPWTTKTTGASSSFCASSSNAAFHQNANDGPVSGSPPVVGSPVRFERLFSPNITIPANAQYVTLDFDTCYDTEDDPLFNIQAYDGFTLRFFDGTPSHYSGPNMRSNLGEAFATEIKTGSIFHQPKHLPRSGNANYFQDMSVWAGDSGGYKHVSMRLPGMAGSLIQLRFEYTQDSFAICTDVRPSHTTCGVTVDNIVLRSIVSTQPIDHTPPVLSVPPDKTVEATSPDGAFVSFPPCTATDDFVSVTVSQDFASPSLFPLGSTTVHCTATDASGNSTSGSFVVHVVDTTPPTITAPPTQVAEATSAAGALVTYQACTSADIVGPVTIAYSQASGTLFPLGDTIVTCVAIDEVGNAATANFQVIVQDTTAPVVVFTGNTTPYTVDQTLNIICSATDAVGVVSDTCANFVGPAFGFGLGTHTYTATATDAAGHTGSATLVFEIRATATSLCSLATTLSTKPGVASSLCAKLDAAAASQARGDVKAHENQIEAFKNEVAAQAGKAFTGANAAFLIAAAGTL